MIYCRIIISANDYGLAMWRYLKIVSP